ncbi:protein of unknown function [Amycolatopsis pretoriensis]|uniref:DUF397 domain-containing protein n=1 Tax=Amycolatopsis pretoriensis TaxID=218821 RepID=A0A1H5RAM0_9PSEU|nr:DUF397 domain-containing protein [Amycolatopsis pretoriensis]SEF34457.1 protein of unknown function [Amycolatopsis pretoriensis]
MSDITSGARWRKSSYSGGGDQQACVEVAQTPDVTAVRDSTDPAGPVIAVPHGSWAAFLDDAVVR